MTPLLRHSSAVSRTRRASYLIAFQGPSSHKITPDIRGGPRGRVARRTLVVLACSQTKLPSSLFFATTAKTSFVPYMSAGITARRPHSGQAKGKDHDHTSHPHSHSHTHSTSFLGGLTHTHGPGEGGHGSDAEQIVEALQKGTGTSAVCISSSTGQLTPMGA